MEDDPMETTIEHASAVPQPHPGSALEVFGVATRLGLTSFGGPIAHLGYFHAEYVARRRWLDEQTYADLVALCQFLPGPASSRAGLAHGRWPGAHHCCGRPPLPPDDAPRRPRRPSVVSAHARPDARADQSRLRRWRLGGLCRAPAWLTPPALPGPQSAPGGVR